MPLQAPELDTRDFDAIFEQALLRIPRYTPEWTDFNKSDPGITLLQLYAWLTEMMLYEMNRVPERNYIKFLQLLDMELRPAQPAQTDVTFLVEAGAEVEPVPVRAQLSADPGDEGDPIIFETVAGLSPLRWPLSDVQVFDGSTFSVVSSANEVRETPFRPFGWSPQVGSALYLGFDPADTSLAPGERVFPQDLRLRVFLLASALKGEAQSCAEALEPPAPPLSLVWEYRASESARWRRLNLYEDETAAFAREGYVTVQGPPEMETTVEGKVAEPRFWLRVRLAAGRYPAGHVPEIDFVRSNTVPAESLSTRREEVVGTSEGHPDQRFTLRYTPVQPDSLMLALELPTGEVQLWQAVDDFLASGPDDRHYRLNATTGEIYFGDGEQGAIPVAGTRIIARKYRHGGGERANVPAGHVNTLVNTFAGVSGVVNERPATGGRDEQDIEALKEQAPARLRSRNRAVTGEDFAALARQAGGVARATAVPLAHPDHPGVEVPGTVTVAVVPDNEEMPPDPSADLIRSVCAYLERFRLLTTEVFVKGPTYLAIRIEARISAPPYASFDAVNRAVVAAINERLHPLRWPFGTDFYPTQLYQVLMDVDGVAAVPDLAVSVDGAPHARLEEPVVVPADGLVYGVSDHDIVVTPLEDR